MSRDPRFVAVHRGGPLDLTRHRLLAGWATDCAEHVLPLFALERPGDDRPRLAVETARAWCRGEVTVGAARVASVAAHAAAREAPDGAARAAARAAGHAVATAHMADHSLGAAWYGVRAARMAARAAGPSAAGEGEGRWQREQLPDAIRELVVSALELRRGIT